jgi:RNA polymerase sigma factor (sigma-70 family)
MTASHMTMFVERLRRTVLAGDGTGLTDETLLTCFVERRDEACFAALVRRHGPMVWGVCRRVLRDHHDAEDAFQDTFLVLALKAAFVVPRRMVANWLYGVAYTTAHRVKVLTARRRARERLLAVLPEPEAALLDDWRELQPLLDEALSRLPDKYRVVILLCDLEGKTRKETARELGCPEGTVAGRLTRARVLLAKRLARHGLAVSGGALAALLSGRASAAVPPGLVGSTIRAASLYAPGGLTGGMIPAKVAALTEGVLQTMLMRHVKTAMGVLVLVAAIAAGVGAGGWTGPTQTASQKVSQVHAPPHEGHGTKSPRAGHIFLTRQHDPHPSLPAVGDNEPHLAMVSPDGKVDAWLTKNLKREEQPNHCGVVAVSPDGRLVAYGVTPQEEYGKPISNAEIFLKAVDGQKPGESLKVRGISWCWSPDGRSLAVTAVEGTGLSHQAIDARTKRTRPLQLPEVKPPEVNTPENAEMPVGHVITDWSSDGKWFLTTVMANGMAQAELFLVKSDGSEAKRIGKGFDGKLSPDGRTALCLDLTWKGEIPDTRLVLLDVKTGRRQQVSRETNGQFVGGYCWSPDGKQIAYVWRGDRDHESEAWETFLMVMDANGQNTRVVLAEKSSHTDGHWYNPFGSPHWR